MKKKHLYLLIFSLIALIFFIFISSSYFKIGSIRIKGHPQNDPRFSELLGKNLFSVNKQMIMSKLKSARIYDCKMNKVLPHSIRITPLLRKDYFLLKTKNYYTPLSKEKIVMEFQGYSPVPIIDLELPQYSLGDTIRDPKIKQIYSLYQLILDNNPQFAEQISEFFYLGEKLYFLKSSPANYVCLGSDDILDKIKKLKSLEKSIDLKNKMIDLSYKNQLIYKESNR